MNKKDKQEIEKLIYIWSEELKNCGQEGRYLTLSEKNLIRHFISDLESLGEKKK